MDEKRVVIADDNEESRKRIRRGIEGKKGFRIVGEAENGTEAIELVKETEPEILILDIVMPETDGYGVLNGIRDMERKPYTVVVSQLNSDVCINKALSLGADYYMLKPLNGEALEEHLREATEKGKRKEGESRYYGKNVKNTMDERLANIFITVGIPAHIKGYQYLREGIKQAIEKPEIINSITKKLYPGIAARYATSASKVERAIRHAIEVAWNRGKIENINGLFGMKVYGSNEKPTNGEFIALLADKLLIEGYGN